MSGTLPAWIERLLGVDEAGVGEGTVWNLDGSWNWPPWVTLLFVVFAVAFIGIIYMREGGEAGRGAKTLLATIRMALVGLVLFMIAEMILSLQRTGLPYVVVLIDESASMGIEDRYDEAKLREAIEGRLKSVGLKAPTRLNLAKMLVTESDSRFLREIEDKYKLKVYSVGATAREQSGNVDKLIAQIGDLEAQGETSRLGQSLRTVLNDLRGTPPAAIVIMTDGITTEGEPLSEAAQYARRKGVPLFTVGIGNEEPIRDLELLDLLVDDVVFVDDIVNFEFKLAGAGLEGRTVQVTLHEEGRSTVLAQDSVTVGPDGEPHSARLQYRPTKIGDFEYVVEVETLPEEASADNNRQSRVVSVRKEQIHTLLVQAYPSWEFRYLKGMLERDTTIELSTVLQEADPEYADSDKSALRVFPIRRDELFEYDVILFGDVNPLFLSASVMASIKEFVTEKGGGIVFMAGPRFTPAAYRDTELAELMPVDLSSISGPSIPRSIPASFRIQPTDLGLTSAHMQLGDTPAETLEIWRNLPGVYWLFEAPALKPGARVLAEHPSQLGGDGKHLPIFAMQYVGAGKVLFHATDETWRWRYLVGDVYFARYWVQTIRYLSRSKLLGKDRSAELVADRREYQRGESVRLRARFIDERLAPTEDDGVTVLLEREGDKRRRLALRRNATNRGIFEGIFSKPGEGKYHAWIVSPTLPGEAPSADFLVAAPPGEFERVQMDSPELKRASVLTKGHYYTLADSARLLGDLPRGRQVPIDRLPPVVLWNRWPLLVLFLSLLVTEWLLRKRKGLL